MNKNHYIYLITNLINGKMYIGKRSCECNINDDTYMGSGKHLKYAQNKYGLDNFIKTILKICETEEQAYDEEKKYIEKYNAVESNMFYNILPGGEGNSAPNITYTYDNSIKLVEGSLIINIEFMKNNQLTLQEKAFYSYLCCFGYKCNLNQNTICKDLNISKPTLRKLIQSLEEKKYIYTQKRYISGTKEKANPLLFPIKTDHKDIMLDRYKKIYPSSY